MDVNRFPVKHRSSRRRPSRVGEDFSQRPRQRNRSIPRHRSRDAALADINHGVCCFAQARRTLCDYVQHRLKVGRRARNDAQDLTRGCLLLQRLFELVEQPNVLDGDHRLVGEGFEQGNLLISERPDFCAPNEDNPNWDAPAQQRCGQYGTCTRALLEVLVFWELAFDLCGDVMDVNRLTVNYGSAAGTSTDDGSLHFRNWYWPIVRDALKATSLNAKNHSIVCLTQPCGILRHHIQNRLQVSR